MEVVHGQEQAFGFLPDEGYHVDIVSVDGEMRDVRSFFTFRNVAEDHVIHITFAENIPPVIDAFSRDTETGDTPLNVGFTVDAHDPDGGRIVRYDWTVEGPRQESRSTYEGNLAFRFSIPGDWTMTVTVTDDEGETATSAPMALTTSNSGPVAIPIPTTEDAVKMKLGDALTETWVMNPFETPAEVRRFLVHPDGQETELPTILVAGFGKRSLFAEGQPELSSGTSLMVEGDRNLQFVTRFSGVLTDMAAPLSSSLESRLYLPHIAEETGQWDTSVYLSSGSTNPNLFASVTVDGTRSDFELQQSNTVDLEDYLPAEANPESSWGMITAGARDPFTNTHVLTGMEIFVRDGGDGAAVQMNRQLFQTLYLPHIPTQTSQFWTGFTLINPDTEPATVQVLLFTDSGETAGACHVVIPPHAKFKGLLEDLCPGSAGLASWGVLLADKPIQGMELYGTDAGGICGYALTGIQYTRATLPLLATDNEHWTGLAIANPGMDAASVTLQLLTSQGDIREQHVMTLGAGTRTAVLLSDLFPGIDIQPDDHVRLSSDRGILALEVAGDLTNSTLLAIPALN